MTRAAQTLQSGARGSETGDGGDRRQFLPMTRPEMNDLGWPQIDILLVTGDAYVDHPSFGAALLGRWLAAHGFRVGIVAQPRCDTTDDILRMGRPRLFAGVTAGALDSMLAHYTAFRKKRREDAYTPGGKAGARPNRACIAYAGLVRRAFPGLPVAAGGIEASMRRTAHYDFWTDSIRRSILLDSKADVLVYGMAEKAILEVAQRLARDAWAAERPDTSQARERLRGIAGTVTWGHPEDARYQAAQPLPSYAELCADPRRLMEATLALERQVHHGGPWLTQRTDERVIAVAPPAEALTTAELDALHGLPFTYRAHPSYREAIPAEAMIRFSITSHRGCAGGCSFCSLALHQGRQVRSRSAASIVGEVQRMVRHPAWRGSVTDVGGPTANMWGARCAAHPEQCPRTSCLFPGICRNLVADQAAVAGLLRQVKHVPGVRHVRTASGIRHDLALEDMTYVKALVSDFVGGQLKLAPEHAVARVLRLMRKPGFEVFERFLRVFEAECRRIGKEQYIIPYLISAFPGCTDDDMAQLASWLRKRAWSPRQVQCFIPTPGTVATAMFAGRIDPGGNPIYVARSDAERLRQHGMLLDAAPRRGAGRSKNVDAASDEGLAFADDLTDGGVADRASGKAGAGHGQRGANQPRCDHRARAGRESRHPAP